MLSRLIGQMGMWNAATRPALRLVESRSTSRCPRCGNGWRDGAAFLAHVRDVVAGDRLDDTFVDALCEPAEVFTYGGMIAHVLTFAAHRRTLVVLACRPGHRSDLGWGDPMTWVAQPV